VKHLISPDSHSILDDLDVLQAETRPLLDVASPDARAEWEKLESRLPTAREIREGFIALSNPELHEMRAKVRRFRDILSSQPGAPTVDQSAAPPQPTRSSPSG
jgi:hypothetical protein